MATPKSGKTTTPSVNYRPGAQPSKPAIQPGAASGVKPTGKGSNPPTKQG